MKDFKVTFNPGLDKKLSLFIGKATKISYIITDVNHEKYQADITMKTDWHLGMLREVILNSFKMCDALPNSVHITEFNLLD